MRIRRSRVCCRLFFVILSLIVVAILSFQFYDRHISDLSSQYKIQPDISSIRFVLARFFNEQLTMCQLYLINLVQVADLIGAEPVAPITCDSRLCTVSGKYCQCLYINGDVSCTKRSNFHGRFCPSNISIFPLYNESSLQLYLQSSHLPQLTSLERFIKYSHRSIILIHLIYYSYNPHQYDGVGAKSVVQSLQEKPIIDCSFVDSIIELRNDFLIELNNLALQYKVKPFNIVTTYCVRSWTPYNGRNLTSEWMLGQNTSIVFTTWRGLATSGGIRLRLNKVSYHSMPKKGFEINEFITKQANDFIQNVTNGRPFLSIHIRTEHFRLRYKTNFKAIKACLGKVRLIREDLLTHNPDLTVLHFWDLGEWGTNTFSNSDISKNAIKLYIKRHVLENGRYKISQYDPSLYGGVDDSGIVSLVETEAMAQAEYLIAVGGGLYQSKIRNKILIHKPKNHVYNLNRCKV